jgi:hypothetical protein
MEAITRAPFTASQLKVVLHLIRMTYGWQRRDAALSYGDFAEATQMARSSAVKAVRELVDVNVIRVVTHGNTATRSVYRLVKNPKDWKGDFKAASYTDTVTSYTDTVTSSEAPAYTDGVTTPIPTQRPPYTDTVTSEPEIALLPQRESAPLKTVVKKDKDIYYNQTREDQASEIISAVNRGMAANSALTRTFTPIPTSHGSRSNVIEWLDEGIPPDQIAQLVHSIAANYRPSDRNRQIHTMAYFNNSVREDHERKQAGNGSGKRNGNGDRSGTVGKSARKDKYEHLTIVSDPTDRTDRSA